MRRVVVNGAWHAEKSWSTRFCALGAKKLVGMLRGGGKKTLPMKAEIWLPGQQVNLD